MIVNVHGGPLGASPPTFVFDGRRADLADAGYYQFLPNPRGSYGQGEAFTRANVKDFGGGDLRDILAGIDAVEKVAPVDDAPARPDRPQLRRVHGHVGEHPDQPLQGRSSPAPACPTGSAITAPNGIDQWMIPFFGASAYDDPAPIGQSRRSATSRARRPRPSSTSGERDIEVPPAQSLEFWHALRGHERAHQPGHLSRRRPRHPRARDMLDIRRRTVAWFDRYLGRTGKPVTH